MDFRRILVLVLSICVVVPLGACSFSTEPGGSLKKPEVEAPDMDAFWAAHAADRQSGDFRAATSILAEDCVLLQPFQPPVSGLRNIAPKFKEALEAADIQEVSFDSGEVYHDGDWLVDFGTFSETFALPDGDGQHVVEGSYAAVLARNADGEWKVKRFMAMPSTPPPPG